MADTTTSGRGMWFCSPVDLWTSIHLRLGINSRQLIMIIQISLEMGTQKTNQVNRVRKQEPKNKIVFLQMKKDVLKSALTFQAIIIFTFNIPQLTN